MEIKNHGNIIHYNNPFKIDSPERDYWLGWILSDGCVVKDTTHAYVYLACLDLDILLKFKEFCGSRAKLNKFKYITPKSKETKIMYKVVINSQELVTFFANNYGICGKKSSTMNPPIDINWNILRGVFDGDGSFKRGVVLTSNSEQWINKIKAFYDSLHIHYTCPHDTAYRLSVYRKEDIKRIYHYLYDNQTLYLDRKKQDLSRLVEE